MTKEMKALYDQATYRLMKIKKVALEDNDYHLLYTRLQELQKAIQNVIKCDEYMKEKEESYDSQAGS